MNKETRTADTITEKPLWLLIGLLPIRVRPMTLAQIWEIGENVSKVKEIDIEGTFNPYQKMFSMWSDAKQINAIVPLILFRSRWARFLFGRYVKKRMTMKRYKAIIEYAALSFDATFFLTNMSFLRGCKETTKTNTNEAIALGDLLAE